MGAGSTALVWYGLCCCAVAFTAIVASGLIAYGNRAEARKRRAVAARSGATEPASHGVEDSQAGSPEDGDGRAS